MLPEEALRSLISSGSPGEQHPQEAPNTLKEQPLCLDADQAVPAALSSSSSGQQETDLLAEDEAQDAAAPVVAHEAQYAAGVVAEDESKYAADLGIEGAEDIGTAGPGQGEITLQHRNRA